MYRYMYMYYVETRADNSGYTNHRVICFVVIGSSALLIVNKYSKFQMDAFDSVWEMDSDKQINRPRDPDADADADTGVTTIARLFFFEKSS